jgi:tripartite-type tricarboxylate transporter receptor subunit TctC
MNLSLKPKTTSFYRGNFRWVGVLLGVQLSFAIPSTFAQQQPFPNRIIENAVWSSAGGGTDLVNRLISKTMEKEMGAKVIVVNRTGGGGSLAMNHVWSKPHDGYNWLGASEAMQNTAVMGFHTTTTKDWRWYMVAGAPASLAVRADSPYKTVDDFIKAAQANPGKVNVSHCAIGCVWHFKWLALAEAAKLNLNLVAYPGSAPAMMGAMSGDVDAVISSISEQAEFIKGGRMRSLGMVEMKPYQFAGMAPIPALGEKFPDIAKMPAMQWLGFAVPADTPKAVTDKLDTAFSAAMKDEELRKSATERYYLNLFGAYGDEAMKILQGMESAVSWRLHEMGIASISPDKFGIAKP